jgi:hypothetical protein
MAGIQSANLAQQRNIYKQDSAWPCEDHGASNGLSDQCFGTLRSRHPRGTPPTPSTTLAGACTINRNFAKYIVPQSCEKNIMSESKENDGPESLYSLGYTALDEWDYKPIIYKLDHTQPWIDMGDSFYYGSLALVKGVVNGTLNEDIEGVAGVYLFRHYLELALKWIVLRARFVAAMDENAAKEEVQRVAKIHDLSALWRSVIEEAKPRIGSWEDYDSVFVEKCIVEFDAVDNQGFAFRYPGHGGEACRFDYRWLLEAMEHIQQVLHGLGIYLAETYAELTEYEGYLESEYGSDMYY